MNEPIKKPVNTSRFSEILTAIIVSPIIGVVIGGATFGWIGLGLQAMGLPRFVAIATTIVGILGVTAFSAYLILRSKHSLTNSTRHHSISEHATDKPSKEKNETELRDRL